MVRCRETACQMSQAFGLTFIALANWKMVHFLPTRIQKVPSPSFSFPKCFSNCSPHFCTLAADYITVAATLFMDHM